MSFLLGMFIFLADQWCKAYVKAKVKLNENIELIKNFVYITHTKNEGAACGLLKNNQLMLNIATVLALLNITYIFKKYTGKSKLFSIAYALILSGGISNLFDRLSRKYVIDYIYFGKAKKSLVYNIADFSIILGVILSLSKMMSDNLRKK